MRPGLFGGGGALSGRRQPQIGQRQPGEVVGGAVVLGNRQVIGKALEIPHAPSFPVSRAAPYPGPMSTTTYAAFLRGMNLGGRRITNRDLAAAVSEVGFEEVETFRASGNVVFAADGGTEKKVSDRLEEGLADSLGYEVPVFLRSAAEVRAIASRKPFKPAQLEASKGKLQVVLLLKKPPAEGAARGARPRHRRRPPRPRGSRALLAAERRHLRFGARPEGGRGRPRADHDPDDGHGRADRGQVFRRARRRRGEAPRARSRS